MEVTYTTWCAGIIMLRLRTEGTFSRNFFWFFKHVKLTSYKNIDLFSIKYYIAENVH